MMFGKKLHGLALTLCLGLAINAGTVWATDAPAEQPSGRDTISTGRYVTSGILGSTLGFGIGHAVQRRYLPLGLIFTIGEAAAFTAMIADAEEVSSVGLKKNYKLGGIGVTALLVYLGLHTWEVIDIWVAGNKLHDGSRQASTPQSPRLTALPVAPGGEAPGMSLFVRF